ncbi:MAG: RimK family alpha-L-glutamate ligase [Bdellovibrionales bacterium]|nr:RimK family alpha-L-glutamate ligase [Bdellovibrionales bacterium]
MRVGIISAERNCYSTKRFSEVGKTRGHEVRVIHPGQVSILLRTKQSDLFVKNVKAKQIDAIIPRIESGSNPLKLAVLRQFEQLGTFCLNTSSAIAIAHDKLRTAQILSRNRIPTPDSAWVLNDSDIPKVIEKLGGAPIVIKVLSGSQGSGVILAESDKVAKAIIEALQMAGHAVLLQRFIRESAGQDIRAFVVGDKVVASMRRIAQGDDFRSNIHKGGRAEPLELDEHSQNVAVRASHAVGLRIAGVDLIESHEGPLVLEVNSSPGLQGIEESTKVDVATEIYKHLEEEVNFPEYDLKEVLPLGKGYAVLQIAIHEESPFRDKSLENIDFRDRGLHLLRLSRGGLTIPFPLKSEVLSLGDVLLFFGKKLDLMTLRGEAQNLTKP